MPQPKKPTEHEIQTDIMDWLDAKGYFFWRNNSGAVKRGKRYIRFGAKGSPDIFVIRNGKIWGIEVKDHRGKLSGEQAEFLTAMQDNGGGYIIARSLEEVTLVLES